MSLLSFYDSFLRSNPLATKMLTNFFICCTGDVICQLITRSREDDSLIGLDSKKKDLDFARTARFGAVGAGVQTTLLHWYLTRIVPRLRFSPKAFPNQT